MKFCCVIGCNNTYKSSTVALHEFPKAPAVRKQWEDFVKVHRSDFSVSGVRPTQPQLSENTTATRKDKVAAIICGDHFRREDYENLFAYERGYDSKRLLKRGAVPTIQPSKETLEKVRASSRPKATVTVNSRDRRVPKTPVHVTNTYDKPRPAKRQRIGNAAKKLEIARLLAPTYVPPPPDTDEQVTTVSAALKNDKKTRSESMQKHAAVQAALPISRKHKGSQARGPTTSVGIQCSLHEEQQPESKSSPVQHTPSKPEVPCYHNDHDEPDYECDKDDPDYEPSEGDWTQERLDMEEEADYPVNVENIAGQYFIVSGECLDELLRTCPVCTGPAKAERHKILGTMLEVKRVCLQPSCGHEQVWRSQRMVRKMAVVNLLLSAAILFGGLQARRTLRLFDHMKIPRITESTFYRHQRLYLEPTIISTWMEQQEHLMARLRNLGEDLVVSGDGRCDSPGYCAKYGTYTLLEGRINRVITLKLVQSNEVPNSSWMENEGLIRCVDDIKGRCPKIGTIITDRHKQNNAWIRENLKKPQGTKHFFDIWHVAKGVGKKIHKLSKLKACEDAGLWRKSVVNHLYWSAGSTQDGDGEMMKAKWLSCVNHMANVHEGHGTLFPECAHQMIEGTKWLHPGTQVLERISDIVENKYLLADIGRLSPKHQTSALESFHALMIRFAPKSTAFSFMGMHCRLLLAALHYNENADRQVATTQNDEPRFTVAFSRSSYGEPFIRQEKVDPTFYYVENLILKLFTWYMESPEKFAAVIDGVQIPPTLASMREKPSKSEMLTRRIRRFVQD